MMHETTKALLMIAMFWSLMVAIRIPEMRLSERWAAFTRTFASAFSAMALTGHTMRPVVLRLQPRRRRSPR